MTALEALIGGAIAKNPTLNRLLKESSIQQCKLFVNTRRACGFVYIKVL